MKIQSHDMQMQSSHAFSKEYISSEVTFSSFIPADERTVESESLKNERLDLLYDDRSRDHLVFNFVDQLLSRFRNQIESIRAEAKAIKMVKSTFTERYQENECLEFSTKGHIQTDKGTLDINLNFSMSRSFVIENRIDNFSLFDPLVINLDGGIPDLSRDTFSFDLDNDGTSDQISKLASGSGFLAFDKNEDGIINQGSELFGTLSGDGFCELAEYDKDKNHWIDENDTIFDKLQIWLKNEDDNERELISLGEAGIGAIFLDSTKSKFSYKTETNQTLGQMKSCGVFLKEDGKCGNISQIDFNIKDTVQKEPLAEILQA